MKTLFLSIMLVLSAGFCFSQAFDAASLQPLCTGPVLYGSQQQADLSTIPPPYNSLLYAKTFRCDIPVSCVLCKVTLGFLENRSDPTLIGPGKRIFTVSLNGGVSDPLDLFILAGPKAPYIRSWTIPVYDKKVHLILTATVLNALLSTVLIENGAGVVGQPCAAPTDLSMPPIIYAVLPDGSCFPMQHISPGFLGDALAVWTAANQGDEIHVQSFFVVMKPVDKSNNVQ